MVDNRLLELNSIAHSIGDSELAKLSLELLYMSDNTELVNTLDIIGDVDYSDYKQYVDFTKSVEQNLEMLTVMIYNNTLGYINGNE